ncbi:MAG: thioredoxin family protein [Betaproteobacteria bacterium TMED41]|nr:MAG: thioredoxin family protein [Betaproteobacteria bacterium TMED41]
MSEKTPLCKFGWKAPDFTLSSTKNDVVNLKKFVSNSKCSGFLIMFICNHCPYVNSIVKKIVINCSDLQQYGVFSLAICSNDSVKYPEDSFEKMKTYSTSNGFTFPYLHDSDQKVAKLYDAKCTPDFFGFNESGLLQYRGRLDATGRQPTNELSDRELFNAMILIARTGEGPPEQKASIGCSIKWK